MIDRLELGEEVDLISVAYQHGGRWLLLTPGAVYPDPVAAVAAVYSPDLGLVASSSGLIPAANNEELIETFDIVASNRWYPFGLTPKQGVRRLLPNHRLNFDTFEAKRHHLGPEPGSVALENAAAAVISTVRATAKAFSNPGLLIGLTAGRDSRMLLAALRPHIDSIEFVTSLTGEGGGNLLDVRGARALAKRFGFWHSVIERRPTTEEEKTNWLARTDSVCAGGRVMHAPNERNDRKREARQGKSFCHGAIGELMRAYYWRKGDDLDTPLSVDEACARIRAPRIPAVFEAAESWLSSIPNTNRLRTLDLLYLEQRVGCWASPGLLGGGGNAPMLYPFNRRDAVDAILGISEENKWSGALINEVIREGWPELLEVPFNEPIGWHRLRYHAKKLMRNPRFVLGAIRRKLLPA